MPRLDEIDFESTLDVESGTEQGHHRILVWQHRDQLSGPRGGVILSSYELLGAAVKYSVSMISLVAIFARRQGLGRFSQAAQQLPHH